MTLIQFKRKMLGLLLAQAKLLCEMPLLEDIKIEPEQQRKNTTTILAILVETEDFFKSIENECSSSDISISE